MAILSILIFISAFLFGYSKPKSALWFAIYTFPLLYPFNFPIVSSNLIYLNITRVIFAIVLGSHLRRSKAFRISVLLKNNFVKLYIVFSLYSIIISLGDAPKIAIFTYVPQTYISLTLGYFLIQNKRDFRKFLAILSWQAFIFTIIIFLDFFRILNIQLIIAKHIPNFNPDNTVVNDVRAGIRRVVGMDGNAIFSAVRLVVLLPISLLYYRLRRNTFLLAIPLLILFAIFILLSRVAYISILFQIIFSIFLISRSESNRVKRFLKAIKITSALVFLLGIIYLSTPFVQKAVNNLIDFSESTSTQENLDARISIFPKVFNYIMEKPIFGFFSSPYHIYFEIVGGHDLPQPLIYVLAGGIPFMLIYFYVFIWMSLFFVKSISKWESLKKKKYVLILVSASFLGGFIPMFSNWIESQVPLMFIIFVATYKYLLIEDQTKVIK